MCIILWGYVRLVTIFRSGMIRFKLVYSITNWQFYLFYFTVWFCFCRKLYTYMYRVNLQCRRPGFEPWVGKIPWRRARQPTPVFWPGESPWTEKPGRLQTVGLQRAGHDWVTKYSTAQHSTAHMTEKYSCLENLHGQRSLAGYSPKGCKELYMTEWLSTANRLL